MVLEQNAHLVPQELLPWTQVPANASSVATQLMRSTESLVVIVLKELLLSVDPQAKMTASHASQERLSVLYSLFVYHVFQDLMKSTELFVRLVHKGLFRMFKTPQVLKHASHAQQDLIHIKEPINV